MLTVSEALAKVLSSFRTLEAESIRSESAVGRVLAEPIRATLDLPPFPNSSMDGYAVRAEDLRTASAHRPTTLTVIGDIPAGAAPAVSLERGTAARIMTGAHVPDGADSVVPIEATGADRSVVDAPPPTAIALHQPIESGAYIRPKGEDVRSGDTVMEAGRVLRVYDIGLLASFGLTRVNVIRRPRVAVISTGDELVEIDQPLRPGQIRDSNSYSLAALTHKYGGEPLMLGVARDRVEAVTAKLQAAADLHPDLIVSSAGVSVGAYDVVKAAVERDGALDFWKVRMRPGKPVAFGQYRGIPFFGLPGNPVSAIVSFEIFVRPVLLKLGGRRNLEKPAVDVKVSEPLHSDGRETYLRAVVRKVGNELAAHSAGGQGSNILSALVNANALVIIPEGVVEIPSGSMVKAWMLDGPEEVDWQ